MRAFSDFTKNDEVMEGLRQISMDDGVLPL